MEKENWIQYGFEILVDFFSKVSDNKISPVDLLQNPQDYLAFFSDWLKQQDVSATSKDDKLWLGQRIVFFIAELLIVKYQSYWDACQDNNSSFFGRFILTGFITNPNTQISHVNNNTVIKGIGSGETRINKMFDPILSGINFLNQSALDLEAHINKIEAELVQ